MPVALETENKAQQIEAQRRDPEQRNRRDVLGQVAGDGQQQNRSASRQSDPQQLVARCQERSPSTASVRNRHHRGCCHAANAQATANAPYPIDQNIACFDSANRGSITERITEQRQHRAEVRECE